MDKKAKQIGEIHLAKTMKLQPFPIYKKIKKIKKKIRNIVIRDDFILFY